MTKTTLEILQGLSEEAKTALRDLEFGWNDATDELMDADLIEYEESDDGEGGDYCYWICTSLGSQVKDLLEET